MRVRQSLLARGDGEPTHRDARAVEVVSSSAPAAFLFRNYNISSQVEQKLKLYLLHSKHRRLTHIMDMV